MSKKKPDATAESKPALDIEMRPIESLKSDPKNVRRHDEKNVVAVVASLKRWGQQKPIVVDEAGVVHAGNATLEAARRLKWTEIAVVVSKLTGAEMRAYAIADNRTAELASWEADVRDVIVDLSTDLPDLDIGRLSFDSIKPARTVLPPAEPPADFTEVPPVEEGQFKCPKCAYEWSGKAR